MRVKDLSGHRIHQTFGLRQQCQRSHMDVAKVIDVLNAADIPGVHGQLNGWQNGVNGVVALQC